MLSSALPARLWLALGFGIVVLFTLTLAPSRIYLPFAHPHNIFHYPNAFHHCPSPHAPARPIDHGTQSCSATESADPAFALQLCHDPSTCNAFTLRVTRTDTALCEAVEGANRPLSDDQELDAWLKHNAGPDTFEIRTDGAERVAGQAAVYEGNCRYRFDVQLRNAGPVWLSAWHTYEYYQAFDEKNGTWPNALSTPLFPQPVSLDICDQWCTPAPRVPLDPAQSLASYPPSKPPGHHAGSSLPACSSVEPVPGSYLPVHTLDLLHPPAPLPQSDEPGTPVAGRYRFVPHGCQWKHGGLRFNDPTECVAEPKKILVLGDSHGRVVADGLYHRLSGHREIMTSSEKQGHKSHHVGNVSIDFFWDPKGLDASCTPGGRALAEFDVLILSMAQHLVWGPTSEYTDRLTSLLDLYKACAGTPPRLVYLSSPAWPARTDWWVSNFDDQRTNTRLRHWRDLALPLARARGWRVVDQFALSAPHIWEVLQLDKAHFLGTDAFDPVVDEVVAKAGLCGLPRRKEVAHRRPGTGH